MRKEKDINPSSSQFNINQFIEQSGLSSSQIKKIQFQQPKRQTRNQRKESTNFKQVIIPNQQKQTHRPTISLAPTKKQTVLTPKKQPRSYGTPKPNKTPQKHNKIQPASVPKSVDQFYQNYSTYCINLFQSNSQQFKFIQSKKQQLFNLLASTVEYGGIVSLISNGYKNNIFSKFLSKFGAKDTQEIFKIYKHYLFHFEYYLLENYQFNQFHDATDLFGQATFVQQHVLKDFLQKTPLDPKYFQHDIMVFINGQNTVGINSQKIHLDKVAQYYKDYPIDIRIQKALDYGFKPRTMRNEPYQMKLSNYRTYQKLCQQYGSNKIDQNFIQKLGDVKDLDVNGTTFKQRVLSQQIFFGVNFDPDDGILFDYINEKTDGTFLGYKQEFDLLSYLDHQVPGCSFPQFYFKVKGVWTGGHQENINMCAVNINHGPDASEWYTMEFKYVQQFRAQLKKEYKMDLYGSQGLWYEKIHWFMEQGKYPIKKIIQKKGDIVISGPGTLHWVRSHGIALQSAWNQFPITYNMMYYAFCRQQENQRINFIRSNTIPLKMLTLKLLNHQPPQLTSEIKTLCLEKVKLWFQKQQQLFQSLFADENYDFCDDSPRHQKLDDLQGFCTKCKQQILIYFVNGKKLEDILCLNCYKKDYKGKNKYKRVYMRNSTNDIGQLITKSESGMPFEEIKSFCSLFVGKVPVKCSQNKYKIQKESIFIDKINQMNQELNKCDYKQMKDIIEKIKSKRQPIENQDDDDKQKEQKCQHDNQQQKMDVQDNHHVQQKKIIQQPKVQQKYVTRTVDNMNVKFIGYHPSQSGWWSFEVPNHLKIVTQQNHCQLLKLIEKQQYHVYKTLQNQNKPRHSHPYFVSKPKPRFNQDKYPSEKKSYNKESSNYYNNKDAVINDPKFSQDEQDQNKIHKKVHKNQDVQDKREPKQSIQYQNFRIKIINQAKQSLIDQTQQKQRKHSSNSRQQSSKKNKQQKSDSIQGKRKRSRSSSNKKSKKSQKQSSRRSQSRSKRSKSRGKSSKRSSHNKEQKSSRRRQDRQQQKDDKYKRERYNERQEYKEGQRRSDRLRDKSNGRKDQQRNNANNDRKQDRKYEGSNNNNDRKDYKDSDRKYDDRKSRDDNNNRDDKGYNRRYNDNNREQGNRNNYDQRNNNNYNRNNNQTQRNNNIDYDRSRGGYNNRVNYNDKRSYNDRGNRNNYNDKGSYNDRGNSDNYNDKGSYNDRGHRDNYNGRVNYQNKGNYNQNYKQNKNQLKNESFSSNNNYNKYQNKYNDSKNNNEQLNERRQIRQEKQEPVAIKQQKNQVNNTANFDY